MKKRVINIGGKVGIIIVVITVFVLVNSMITDNKKKSFVPTKDSNKYAYQIEEVTLDEDLVIKGWFIELKNVQNKTKKIADGKKLGIVLYPNNSDEKQNINNSDTELKGVSLDVVVMDRFDVNQYFDCEYDYSKCGFIARVNIESINMDTEYQVVFKPEAEDFLGVLSANYIYKGELSYIQEQDKTKLDVEDTFLEKVVSDGICLGSYPQKHAFVYQYKWELYYIFEKEYYSEDHGNIFITNGFDTTQFDKLPETDKSDGRFWSYVNTQFVEDEITENENCGKYRVSVHKLPIDFSIYWILDRCNLDEEKVYEKYYRPVYYLKK